MNRGVNENLDHREVRECLFGFQGDLYSHMICRLTYLDYSKAESVQ